MAKKGKRTSKANSAQVNNRASQKKANEASALIHNDSDDSGYESDVSPDRLEAGHGSRTYDSDRANRKSNDSGQHIHIDSCSTAAYCIGVFAKPVTRVALGTAVAHGIAMLAQTDIQTRAVVTAAGLLSACVATMFDACGNSCREVDARQSAGVAYRTAAEAIIPGLPGPHRTYENKRK